MKKFSLILLAALGLIVSTQAASAAGVRLGGESATTLGVQAPAVNVDTGINANTQAGVTTRNSNRNAVRINESADMDADSAAATAPRAGTRNDDITYGDVKSEGQGNADLSARGTVTGNLNEGVNTNSDSDTRAETGARANLRVNSATSLGFNE